MALNKDLINDIITVTSKAAISCYDFIGKNQKKNADKAATDSMRNEINKLSINLIFPTFAATIITWFLLLSSSEINLSFSSNIEVFSKKIYSISKEL